MDVLMDWGIEVILWVQQFHPTFDFFFEAITFTGDEMFFLIFLPFLYWCLDRGTGARFLALFLISSYVNDSAKHLFDQPRPFLYDDRVWHYSQVGGSGGFPSGHTQAATVMWGYLIAQFRERWLWILGGTMMILVPLSRVYLGVHFPHDLLGGYLIGAVVLFAYLWLSPSAERWLASQDLYWQIGLAAISSVIMALVLPTENGIAAAATTLGVGSGVALERHWIRFEVTGTWQARGIRYVLGIVVTLILWAGLRAAFASLEPASLFRYLRYGTVGVWLGLGAPWLFVQLEAKNRPQ